MEPIPAVIGREVGYTLDRSPVHHSKRISNPLKVKKSFRIKVYKESGIYSTVTSCTFRMGDWIKEKF